MPWRTNILSELRDEYARELYPLYGKEEADSLLRLLIERYFGKSRADLVVEPEYRISESEMLRLHFAVKELKAFRPIQYILKSVEFMNTRLLVDESVLIPRPETEEMAAWIADREKGNKGLKVMDLGTGSGCIAIALAKHLPESEVHGIDISEKALTVAGKNQFANEVMVQFHHADMLDPDSYAYLDLFDVVVSNPPYVTFSEKKFMRENVLRYEPASALFVRDEEPLLFYRAILYFSKEKLRDGGRIYLEINERYGKEVAALAGRFGFGEVTIRQDLSGKDRFVSGIKQTLPQ